MVMESSTDHSSRPSFLTLPAELRTKIYTLTLGGNTIHIGGTAHQRYSEGYIDDGRCCSCTAKVADEECFAKYTARGKALRGSLPEDKFTKRHRDCHRYPVSRLLNLNILSVCKQIHEEAASIPFGENIFTLTMPFSLPPFLARLNSKQLASLRQFGVYSTESHTTWFGQVLSGYDLDSFLTGFRRLRVFVEVKQFDITQHKLHNEQVQQWRLAGLSVFKLSRLRTVEVMIVTPDWEDLEAEDLGETTMNGLQKWELNLKRKLMPLLPLQLGTY